MHKLEVPNSIFNKLVILLESWVYTPSEKAIEKIVGISVSSDVRDFQIGPHFPARPSGALLNKEEDFEGAFPSRFSDPDAEGHPAMPLYDGLNYHCCH